MNLNQTLLDAARDEVARKHGFSNFKGVWSMGISYPVIVEEAALLAMERLARFRDWLQYETEYELIDQDARIWNVSIDMSLRKTELELYSIWREATTQQ